MSACRLKFAGLLFLISACSVDNAKNHFALAEKLWSDQKYAASIPEFERVINKDPRGPLGLQALYRAAMTQALFLSQYPEALEKLNTYIQFSQDKKGVKAAKVQVGEILYEKLENYESAIRHYQNLLKEPASENEYAQYRFRIGKSFFFLLQFQKAESVFQEMIQKHPATDWSEKAQFELGTTYFTEGAQESDKKENQNFYEKSISAFESYLKLYPSGDHVMEARFGIASCYEELNRLEEAFDAYTKLKMSYPSPEVIEVKLSRIRDRISQKKGSK